MITAIPINLILNEALNSLMTELLAQMKSREDEVKGECEEDILALRSILSRHRFLEKRIDYQVLQLNDDLLSESKIDEIYDVLRETILELKSLHNKVMELKNKE
jgi:hypothetical protein